MLTYEKYKFKFFFFYFYLTLYFCNLFTVFVIGNGNKGTKKEGKETRKESRGSGEKYLDRRRDYEISWEESKLNMYQDRKRT